MSFGPKGERLRRQMLGRLPTTLWMWRTLPLAAFAGLRVARVDTDRNLIFLRGGVPGPKGGLVTVRKAVKAK